MQPIGQNRYTPWWTSFPLWTERREKFRMQAVGKGWKEDLLRIVQTESALGEAGKCIGAPFFSLDATHIHTVYMTLNFIAPPFQRGNRLTFWALQITSPYLSGVDIMAQNHELEHIPFQRRNLHPS